eukprot:TRINITY_DN280_c0_g1_i1.p1 TRINITY_DN280_c0_g1~~TRINITY_DN280_c0_g1_i1.p1  ORF type:complete len:250 (+),score=35.95 TRINITY_DN280_c0_g1_i1:64-750(+)
MKIYQLLSVVLFFACAHGILFEVKPGVKRCVSEELRRDTLVSGTYEVSDKLTKSSTVPYEHAARAYQMDFVIEDPKGIVVYSKNDVSSGSFAHHTEIDGEYKMCFTDNTRKGTGGGFNFRRVPSLNIQSRTVFLALKSGVEARDYAEVAKKENLQPLEVELRKIEDATERVKDDMLYLKQREEEMRDTNESTNTRVVNLSIFSTLVLVSTAIFQIVYLKRYFQVKKLI